MASGLWRGWAILCTPLGGTVYFGGGSMRVNGSGSLLQNTDPQRGGNWFPDQTCFPGWSAMAFTLLGLPKKGRCSQQFRARSFGTVAPIASSSFPIESLEAHVLSTFV